MKRPRGLDLHRDQGGAIAPLMILLFVFFSYWIVVVLNAGQLGVDKHRVQNGADIAAMTHADWTGRSLNVMAMNNVALTQALVALVASETVLEAELDLGERATQTGITIVRMASVCDGIPPCIAYYVARSLPAFAVAAKVVIYQLRYDPWTGIRASRATIAALNRMNDKLMQSLPRRASDAARQMFADNDIDDLLFYPRCENGEGCGGGGLGRDLPVSKSGDARALAYAELCDAAANGSNGMNRLNYQKLGYPNGRGPLRAGGSSSHPEVKDYISEETGLGALYQQFYAAYPFPEPDIGTTIPPLYDEPQTVASNDFTKKFDNNWRLACPGGALIGLFGGGLVPTPYWLLGSLLGKVGLPSRFSDGDEFKILAVAARKRRAMIRVNLFREVMQTDYGYAQFWVFNPSSADLYTQNWQDMLSPATFMDRPSQVAAQLPGQNSLFEDLHNLFDKSGDPDAFAAVNDH